MTSKKNPQDGHKRIKITIETKHEIIEKREQGMSVSNLARMYNRSTSTICTILKNKNKIKEMDASKGVTRISAQRLRILDDVEKLLLVWINEKNAKGEIVNEKIICEKAKIIFADIIKMKSVPLTGEAEELFKASRGWFGKFKRRSGIHSILRHGDAKSSDTKVEENFIKDFKKLIDSEGYLPQQVFNCDETVLFWKRMPKRTYLAAEENLLTDAKPMEDRLAMLLCANASGDLKIKPLVVYHTETPRAFNKCRVQKSRLKVMWRSNEKAWITCDLFVDWINEVFGPSVKKYLLEMNLPFHALLVMDSSPAHPQGLQEDFLEEYKFIKIHFLPPNLTALVQPMNQQIISNFKKLYTKKLFEHCFEITEGTNLTLGEFWRDHFHIVSCLKMIEKAWEEVSKKILVSAWKKLWPEYSVECEEFETEPADTVVNDIVSLANTMGLEVNENDIDELVEEHNQNLTTEDPVEPNRASQQVVIKKSLWEKEEEEEKEKEEKLLVKQPSSDAIINVLKLWETVTVYIEKHHPNEAVAVRSANLFNDNAVAYFHKILKEGKKQIPAESLLAK